MVTHDPQAAAQADRILFLADGRIVKEIAGLDVGRGAGRDAGSERTMTAVALRGLLGRKLRSILTGLAIVLGVAMISGTYILTDTIDKAFTNVFNVSYRHTERDHLWQAVRHERQQRSHRSGRGAGEGPGAARRRGGHRFVPVRQRAAHRSPRQDHRERRRTQSRLRRRPRPAAVQPDNADVRPLGPGSGSGRDRHRHRGQRALPGGRCDRGQGRQRPEDLYRGRPRQDQRRVDRRGDAGGLRRADGGIDPEQVRL